MPGLHAKLSPSSAERWLSCPGSVRLAEQVPPEPSSSYAEEGTCAHDLGEIKASYAFGHDTEEVHHARMLHWRKEWPQYAGDEDIVAEMELHTDAYVALLKERAGLYPNTVVLLEQRLDSGVPRCWGTSDSVLVSPSHVEIVDFKYGSGVAVEAHGNPQLRLYALGALDEYGDLLGETEVIRITVHQPRMDHVLTEELTPDALRAWRTDVAVPGAELALTDDAPLNPSEAACRWCPVSGRCRAQLEAVFATDFEEEPETLEPEEMAETLGRLKLVRDWLNAFEAAALDTVYSQGREIPGYKVVLSGGQRKVLDPDAAIRKLVDAGFRPEEISTTKPKGIGDLEKLLGKERFAELLEKSGLVKKSEGKPALVPNSDYRPSITPNQEAAKDFAGEEAS